jgi:outer membrane biosynthesis protein TonB
MTPSSFPPRRSAFRRLAPAVLILAALWPGLMGLPLAQQSDQPAIRARLGADGRLEVVSLSPAAQTAPAGTVAPIEAISSAVRPIDREAAQSLDELLGDPSPAKTPEPRPEPAPAAPEPNPPEPVPPEPAQPQLPEPAPAVKPAASEVVKPTTHTTPTQVTPPTAVASAASAIESPVLAASQPEPPAAASAASADSAASAASASLIESVRQSLGNISPGTAAAVAVGVGIVVAGAAAVLGVAGTAAGRCGGGGGRYHHNIGHYSSSYGCRCGHRGVVADLGYELHPEVRRQDHRQPAGMAGSATRQAQADQVLQARTHPDPRWAVAHDQDALAALARTTRLSTQPRATPAHSAPAWDSATAAWSRCATKPS